MKTPDLSHLSFGKRLRLLREEERFTRPALSRKTGIPSRTIEKYEYELITPHRERIEIFANALGVTHQYLLTGHL